MSAATGRRLRADAERSVQVIMQAAERVLAENPAATMEQIAEAAGVARTTIHRRFASREALIEIMTLAAWQEIDDAVEAARPHAAPPLIAMHQATANVLLVKPRWRFALHHLTPLSEEAARIEASVIAKCDAVLARARDEGHLRPDTDLDWARRVYLALLGDVCDNSPPDADPDALAAQLVHTMLHGLGAR